MKTAISIPDDTFDRASQRAKELGMSRSEFFSRAADSYLDQLDSRSITRRINRTLAEASSPDESQAAAVSAAHQSLAESDEQW